MGAFIPAEVATPESFCRKEIRFRGQEFLECSNEYTRVESVGSCAREQEIESNVLHPSDCSRRSGRISWNPRPHCRWQLRGLDPDQALSERTRQPRPVE